MEATKESRVSKETWHSMIDKLCSPKISVQIIKSLKDSLEKIPLSQFEMTREVLKNRFVRSKEQSKFVKVQKRIAKLLPWITASFANYKPEDFFRRFINKLRLQPTEEQIQEYTENLIQVMCTEESDNTTINIKHLVASTLHWFTKNNPKVLPSLTEINDKISEVEKRKHVEVFPTEKGILGLKSIFKFYIVQGRRETMDIKLFLKFCKDFELTVKLPIVSLEQTFRTNGRELNFDDFLAVLKHLSAELNNKNNEFFDFLGCERREVYARKLQPISTRALSNPASPMKAKPIMRHSPQARLPKISGSNHRRSSILKFRGPHDHIKIANTKQINWQNPRIHRLKEL